VIDAMTLFEVAELTEYWAEHPPAHIALAAFLGIKGRRAAARMRAATPDQLLGELGPGFAPGDVGAGLPPVVLDFAALAGAAAG
jgi:hypothetical protein